MNISNKHKILLLLIPSIICLGVIFPSNLLAQSAIEEKDSLVLTVDTIIEVEDVVVEEVILDTLAQISPQELPDTIIAASQLSKEEEEDKAIAKRMQELYNAIPLIYNKKVKGFINYFSGRNRNYLLTMERRKNLFFPHFEETLKKYGMPDEIKYLPIVESGLNPMAISRAGAAGPWQFMPGTGIEMGLKVNEIIDERLDPIKSTDAACRYLLRMYKIFGDWELALASYNCGPGVVRRAIRQSGGNTFWKIYDYLPSETRGYVPQFVAVIYVMNNLSQYNMVADSIQFPMDTDTLLLKQFVNLQILCEQLDFCYEDFIKLNPAIRSNILPENVHYPIRLPREKKLEFLLNQHEISECINISTTPVEVFTNDRRKSSSTNNSIAYRQKIIHTVRNGEVLGKIAGKYGTTVTQLKSWNKLKSNTIRVGQKLVVYNVKYSKKTTNTPAVAATPSKSAPKYYYVKPGDTLWTISRKYEGLTIDKLKKLNKLRDNAIKVGQKLILI